MEHTAPTPRPTSTSTSTPGLSWRRTGLALLVGLVVALPAQAQLSVSIGMPGISIGLNLNAYPQMVLVPGYPVYYAPGLSSNYFYYDNDYWVFRDDAWYRSGWYNGPWQSVMPAEVPLYLLRIPVLYYRQPPIYFQGWQRNAPPRWGEHWGNAWAQQRPEWDQWDRRARLQPAPLPTYQRQYQGDRYPQQADRQASLRTQHERQADRPGQPDRPQKPQTQVQPQRQPPQAQQPQASPQERPNGNARGEGGGRDQRGNDNGKGQGKGKGKGQNDDEHSPGR